MFLFRALILASKVGSFGFKHLLFLDGFKIPLQAQKCSNCKACPYEKYLFGVRLPSSLTDLPQTLHLGPQFLFPFCTWSSDIKCFFHLDPMECLSLLSLFFMCLECAGMYVNTSQSHDPLFSPLSCLPLPGCPTPISVRTLQVLARLFWRKINAIK